MSDDGVTYGAMRVRSVGPQEWGRLMDARLMIEDQTVTGADFSGWGGPDHWFVSVGSRFVDCRFDGVRAREFSFGSGMAQSVYVGCSFDRLDLARNSSPGFARFENCSFRDVRFTAWNSELLELVGCVFTGTLRECIFWGSPIPGSLVSGCHPGRVNEILDNDFAGCELVATDFRRGIDLRRQKLPSGPDYVYREDGPRAIADAFRAVAAWSRADRQRAELMLEPWRANVVGGQEQLFAARNDLPRSDQWLWPRLRDVLTGSSS